MSAVMDRDKFARAVVTAAIAVIAICWLLAWNFAQGQTLTTPLPAGCTPTLSGFTVTCTPPAAGPALSFAPAALPFGDVSVGVASAPQTVTVRNSGSGTLTLGTFSKEGANADDFVRLGTCSPNATLTGAQSCTSIWTFTPAAAGARSATHTMTSSAGNMVLPLSGTGTATAPPSGCGDLKVTEADFTFDPQTTRDISLGKGTEAVYILRYTVQPSDAGKASHINIVEHGTGAHYKTVWASKTKCEMTDATMQGSNSSPSVYVSVNGQNPVNMAVGETWYFMFRNLSYSGKNTCGAQSCGERITAYLWHSGPTVMQRGGPLPKRDQPTAILKKK